MVPVSLQIFQEQKKGNTGVTIEAPASDLKITAL